MPLPDERRSFEEQFACILIVCGKIEICAIFSSFLER
jgi:hypothetical protein